MHSDRLLVGGAFRGEAKSLPTRAGHQDGCTIPVATTKGMAVSQGEDLRMRTEDSLERLYLCYYL